MKQQLVTPVEIIDRDTANEPVASKRPLKKGVSMSRLPLFQEGVYHSYHDMMLSMFKLFPIIELLQHVQEQIDCALSAKGSRIRTSRSWPSTSTRVSTASGTRNKRSTSACLLLELLNMLP